jgi:hypothetical protein
MLQGVPHDWVINSPVVVRDNIAHSPDRPPGHVGMLFLELLAEPPGRLADPVGQRLGGKPEHLIRVVGVPAT